MEIAINGEEAVRKIKGEFYNLVFTDCQMPVIDGFEAAGIIRRWEISNGPILIKKNLEFVLKITFA